MSCEFDVCLVAGGWCWFVHSLAWLPYEPKAL